MSIQEYLSQGRRLDQRIEYHLRKLEELHASAETLPSAWVRDTAVQVSRDGNARFVSALERVEEMEEEVNREINQMLALKRQIKSTIGQLKDEGQQLVLMYRYLDCMPWNEIAGIFGMDPATMRRWERNALKTLRLPENPIVIGAV